MMSVTLPRDRAYRVWATMGTVQICAGILVREALHRPASTTLALVDEGFRIPFIDPTGSVPRDPGKPLEGRTVSSPPEEAGKAPRGAPADAISFAGEDPSSKGGPVGHGIEEKDLWSA